MNNQTIAVRMYVQKNRGNAAGRIPIFVRMDQVRDVFVFCCFTGLAHCDVLELTEENIRIYDAGNKWLRTHRQKTAPHHTKKPPPPLLAGAALKLKLCYIMKNVFFITAILLLLYLFLFNYASFMFI